VFSAGLSNPTMRIIPSLWNPGAKPGGTVQIDYQNSAAYERTLTKFKENIMAFFKQEGLVK
jgi:hypothetical protein